MRVRHHAPEALAHDGDVVKRDLAAAFELLALLVPLAGDDHHVPRLGGGNGALDGDAAVDLVLDVVAAADEDLLDDRVGVLGPRVVGGDDDAIGKTGGDLPHQRALAAVAVAAAPEDDVQPPGGQRTRRPEDVLQRVRGVGVVHEHGVVLTLGH